MKNDLPLLSVCLITYNHANYIKESIESVLMQQTEFNWELIIADDVSKDGTREILIDYRNRFPDKIKLILQKENKGPAQNWLDLITTPKTKYIAYLEGDDYWTDPLKLQKQVDVLEKNPSAVLCFHNAIVKQNGREDRRFNDYSKTVYEAKDFFDDWVVPSASMLFRNKEGLKFPDWFKTATHGDLGFLLLLGESGNFILIDECMCVYRINEGSITVNEFNKVQFRMRHIEQLKGMAAYFGKKYESQIHDRIFEYSISTAYVLAKGGIGGTAYVLIKRCLQMNFPGTMISKYFYITLFYLIIKPASWKREF